MAFEENDGLGWSEPLLFTMNGRPGMGQNRCFYNELAAWDVRNGGIADYDRLGKHAVLPKFC